MLAQVLFLKSNAPKTGLKWRPTHKRLLYLTMVSLKFGPIGIKIEKAIIKLILYCLLLPQMYVFIDQRLSRNYKINTYLMKIIAKQSLNNIHE